MRKFSTEEINSFISTAESTLMDSCNILVASGYQDTYGQELYSYITVSGIECGFHPTRSFTNFRGDVIIPEYDAEIRLKLTQSITSRDRISFDGKVYDIDGINKGRTCQVLFLKEFDI